MSTKLAVGRMFVAAVLVACVFALGGYCFTHDAVWSSDNGWSLFWIAGIELCALSFIASASSQEESKPQLTTGILIAMIGAGVFGARLTEELTVTIVGILVTLGLMLWLCRDQQPSQKPSPKASPSPARKQRAANGDTPLTELFEPA